MTDIAERALNIADLREMARRRLPRGIFEFVDRGSEDDIAVLNNSSAFRQIHLRPRFLRDVSRRTLATPLLGSSIAMPLAISPTGAAGLFWHDGEIAVARAAAKAGIPFTLSTVALTSMERVATEAGGRLWFQLYMWPERAMSHQLVKRAKAAGYEALVVTVDTPVTPNREYNRHNGFSLPFKLNPKNFADICAHPTWLMSVMGRYLLTTGMPRFENYPEELQRQLTAMPVGRRAHPKNDSLTWDDLKRLRDIWEGPLLVKGILHPDDAQAAAESGADAVIVSNHGGRNLDASIAPILALPDIVERVGKRLSVIIDSGFRRGSDIVKALALGANAVMVGRPPLWGVAAGGEQGVSCALKILQEETDRVMASVGCSSPSEITTNVLVIDRPPGVRSNAI
jgi:isopentenyl diphosphate isomerase/L-lactate dehydrogenase-like FMN-dependent dehydrogenase